MFNVLIYNIMKKRLLFLVLMAFGFSNGQNIFRDDFSTYTVNSPLNAQGGWTNNSQTFGLGECLSPGGGVPCLPANVITTSLSYPDYGTASKASQMNIRLDNPGRAILPIINSGTFYVAAVIKTVDAPTVTTPTDFIRIGTASGPITERLLMKQDGFGFKLGIVKGVSSNAIALTTDSYNIGESILVILKYIIQSGTNDDIVSLFVNPNFSNGEPATASATTSSGLDQSTDINRFVLRFGYNPIGSLPNGNIGLVSVARTWADLAFPPLAITQINNNNVNIFANNDGFLNINSNSTLNNVKLNMYTITGALIEKQNINLTVNDNQIKINLLKNNSIYIAELIDENGNKYTKKITLN